MPTARGRCEDANDVSTTDEVAFYWKYTRLLFGLWFTFDLPIIITEHSTYIIRAWLTNNFKSLKFQETEHQSISPRNIVKTLISQISMNPCQWYGCKRFRRNFKCELPRASGWKESCPTHNGCKQNRQLEQRDIVLRLRLGKISNTILVKPNYYTLFLYVFLSKMEIDPSIRKKVQKSAKISTIFLMISELNSQFTAKTAWFKKIVSALNWNGKILVVFKCGFCENRIKRTTLTWRRPP